MTVSVDVLFKQYSEKQYGCQLAGFVRASWISRSWGLGDQLGYLINLPLSLVF